MQIRTRLTIQFIFIVACIMLVAIFYIQYQFKQNIENELYSNLESKVEMTAHMVLDHLQENEFTQDLSNQNSNLNNYTENICVYSQSGKLLYSFNPLKNNYDQDLLALIKNKEKHRFRHGDFFALGLNYQGEQGEPYIIIAESILDTTYLLNLRNILIWMFFIFIALVALAGRIFAGQALAPINRIMNQMDAILPSDMNQRLEVQNQQDEMSRLVITFNNLLDRIQHAFENQKLFLSNLSHEIRNPLNVIISQIEIVLANPRTNTEYQDTLRSILEDTRELNEVANKLMQLSRIAMDDNTITFSKLRVDELIWQTKESLQKTHPHYRVNFEIGNLPVNEDQLSISGNEQLLKTALYNLMENGCKYSPEKQVKVRLSFMPNGHPRIDIADRGPGIPEQEVALVFKPFYRGTLNKKTMGSGIGLSLVDSILKLHKIKINVASQQGVGSTFSLEF